VSVLFLHEVHQVRGSREDEFEAAYRDAYFPALAAEDGARLLWYLHHAHGSGPAYHFVTITAVSGGDAYERLVQRVQFGDLRDWARQLDELRHTVTSKILVSVEWSPMADLRLEDVPATVTEHELSIYMEDTGWPHASIDDYVDFWHHGYYEPMRAHASSLLDIKAVFQSAFGSGPHKEAVLMQKIVNHDALLHLLTHETPPELRAPGQFMHEALAYRDRWESKLLRTSSWSPLF
jgi:hypothetical protein